MLVLIIAYVMLINLITVVQFGRDKQLAIAGGRRIPEADLLLLALVGGSPGALLARQWFRHKTRKQPFSNILLVIVALQIGAGAGLLLG